MKILVDTNLVIYYLRKRDGFFQAAERVFTLCASAKISGFISTRSIADLFYILRKDYSISDRKRLLIDLCHMFTVIGVDRIKVINALANNDFSDFEDCLQCECAKAENVNYVITRNVKYYAASSVQAMLPEDFLQLVRR